MNRGKWYKRIRMYLLQASMSEANMLLYAIGISVGVLVNRKGQEQGTSVVIKLQTLCVIIAL